MIIPRLLKCFFFCRRVLIIAMVQASLLIAAFPALASNPELAGGQATVFNTGRNAYSLPSANMPLMEQLNFSVGNSFFRNPWVIAPATTDARDGLGPLMNTNACQSCHIKDGRGHAPASHDDIAVSYLVRMSIATKAGPRPEPNYGQQLQDFANPGVVPEARIQIDYEPVLFRYKDGDTLELRRPKIRLDQLAYGALHPQVQLSARIASPMIGLGLLEAIPAQHIMANEDPQDQDKDGISGKANQVLDLVTSQQALGRFGWKAGQPSVRQQNAAAFNGDLGITSLLFPKDDCTSSQQDCLSAANGGEPELTQTILDAVTFYAKNLAVPARRNVQAAQVQQGEALFSKIGCAQCHQPSWKTGQDQDMPWLSSQTIYPYTDLLLHDMGEDLADHRPEAQANGLEWRTPPLWGIGLAKVVHQDAGFLHDGRAQTIEEAIVWHGGEASQSTSAFSQLSRQERQALLAFLQSL